MRYLLVVAAAWATAATLQAQDAQRPVVSSRDRIDGPVAGAHRVEDLKVFADGRIVYVEETTQNRTGNARKSVYRSRIPSEGVRHLVDLLDHSEIRSLPKNLPSTIAPIDFFWLKFMAIARTNETQEIRIENFYPFINMHQPVYPRPLIELECRLQDIKTVTSKRPKDEGSWCKALLTSDASATVAAACPQDSSKPEIIAGVGWGPVRLGAPLKAVDGLLDKGQRGNGYNDVYFKQYAPKGIEVSFDKSTDTVHAIFFYNRQADREEFGVFCGQAEKRIGWQSSVQDVKSAFGKPTSEFSGAGWVRLVFDGIDFRFENGKMVRIGIPGR